MGFSEKHRGIAYEGQPHGRSNATLFYGGKQLPVLHQQHAFRMGGAGSGEGEGKLCWEMAEKLSYSTKETKISDKNGAPSNPWPGCGIS